MDARSESVSYRRGLISWACSPALAPIGFTCIQLQLHAMQASKRRVLTMSVHRDHLLLDIPLKYLVPTTLWFYQLLPHKRIHNEISNELADSDTRIRAGTDRPENSFGESRKANKFSCVQSIGSCGISHGSHVAWINNKNLQLSLRIGRTVCTMMVPTKPIWQQTLFLQIKI